MTNDASRITQQEALVVRRSSFVVPTPNTQHPTPKWDVEAIGSYQNLNISGNRSRFHQYNVRPSGAFVDLLRLTLRDDSSFRFGSGQWTGLDESRQTAAVRLEELGPARSGVSLRYGYDRAAFFIEPSLESVDASDRKRHVLVGRLIPSAGGPELSVALDTHSVFGPGLGRLAIGTAPGALNYRVETLGPRLQFPVGDGALTLAFLREDFTDRTRFLPHARDHTWQARYSSFVGANTAVFAALSRASISQSGLPDHARVNRTEVGVAAAPFRTLTASAQLSIDDFRQLNTRNAFVRDRDLFETRLRYRPQNGLTLEGGYERMGLRRVNNTQTFIHTPRWDGGWLLLRLAPRDNITLSARHRMRRMRHAPPAAITALPSTLPLFYDDDDRTDAQLTIALPRDMLLYSNYWRNRRHNDAREIGFRFDTWNVGLSMPLTRLLSFNADWSRQNWSGRGDALTQDPLRLNFGRPLTSDGSSVSLGLAYVPGRDTLTLNLYRFESSGGEAIRAQGLMFGYERPLAGWFVSRFQVGWDDYDDRILPGFDNSDAFIRVDLARRF